MFKLLEKLISEAQITLNCIPAKIYAKPYRAFLENLICGLKTKKLDIPSHTI